jgi:hypothetical protein
MKATWWCPIQSVVDLLTITSRNWAAAAQPFWRPYEGVAFREKTQKTLRFYWQAPYLVGKAKGVRRCRGMRLINN